MAESYSMSLTGRDLSLTHRKSLHLRASCRVSFMNCKFELRYSESQLNGLSEKFPTFSSVGFSEKEMIENPEAGFFILFLFGLVTSIRGIILSSINYSPDAGGNKWVCSLVKSKPEYYFRIRLSTIRRTAPAWVRTTFSGTP
jgi:hypothetical protein